MVVEDQFHPVPATARAVRDVIDPEPTGICAGELPVEISAIRLDSRKRNDRSRTIFGIANWTVAVSSLEVLSKYGPSFTSMRETSTVAIVFLLGLAASTAVITSVKVFVPSWSRVGSVVVASAVSCAFSLPSNSWVVRVIRLCSCRRIRRRRDLVQHGVGVRDGHASNPDLTVVRINGEVLVVVRVGPVDGVPDWVVIVSHYRETHDAAGL